MKYLQKLTLISILIISLNVNLIISVANGQSDDEYLPVLLIHGYASDATVWMRWLPMLANEGITAYAVTFPDNPLTTIDEDKCGRTVDRVIQLKQIIILFKEQTGAEKVNIVTHSKGGLDTRVYLANNPSNNDVKNLIMIGTPNEGSPIADRYYTIDPCKPAVYDLMTTSNVNKVNKNENTEYYTVAGNWVSEYYWVGGWLYVDINCPYPMNWFNWEGWNWVTLQNIWRFQIIGDDDGIVPVVSVEEPGEFIPLGQTNNCHTNLFTDEEYNFVIPILKQR